MLKRVTLDRGERKKEKGTYWAIFDERTIYKMPKKKNPISGRRCTVRDTCGGMPCANIARLRAL